MNENPRASNDTDEDRDSAGTGRRRSSRSGEGRSGGRTRASAERGSENGGARGAGDRATAMSAIAILRKAREQFEELTGHRPESISALSRAGEGWEMKAEVVELERVPDTMSLLASYTVTLDENGDVVGYERTRRYTRGRDDPDC